MLGRGLQLPQPVGEVGGGLRELADDHVPALDLLGAEGEQVAQQGDGLVLRFKQRLGLTVRSRSSLRRVLVHPHVHPTVGLLLGVQTTLLTRILTASTEVPRTSAASWTVSLLLVIRLVTRAPRPVARSGAS